MGSVTLYSGANYLILGFAIALIIASVFYIFFGYFIANRIKNNDVYPYAKNYALTQEIIITLVLISAFVWPFYLEPNISLFNFISALIYYQTYSLTYQFVMRFINIQVAKDNHLHKANLFNLFPAIIKQNLSFRAMQLIRFILLFINLLLANFFYPEKLIYV